MALHPIRRAGLGLAAFSLAGMAAVSGIAQPAQAEGILETLQMLEATGTSRESGLGQRSFDLAVIDTMIGQLMEMADTALMGMESEDPEIAAMSEKMLNMIESELETLNSMRRSILADKLEMLRGTSPESGIE